MTTVRRARWPLAVVVALVVGMFLLGFPLRTYVEQRASLAHARQTVVRLASDNRALHAQAAQLQTPAEIERLARERYGLVRPGQEEYAILPAPGYGIDATALTAGAVRAAPKGVRRPAVAASPGGLWSRFLHQLEFWN